MVRMGVSRNVCCRYDVAHVSVMQLVLKEKGMTCGLGRGNPSLLFHDLSFSGKDLVRSQQKEY